MKAAFFRSYGPPEVLEYGEVPDPVAGPGEVLADIHAASVNAADWKMRSGQYPAKLALPHIPGRDFSGVVAAQGEGAHDFGPGDPVFGVCEVPGEGGYAEKIALRQEIVDVTARSFAVLRPGGRLASVAAGARAPESPRTDVASLRPKVDRDRRHLERVVDLLVAGALRLPEITVYPLSEAAAAHRVSEARHLARKARAAGALSLASLALPQRGGRRFPALKDMPGDQRGAADGAGRVGPESPGCDLVGDE